MHYLHFLSSLESSEAERSDVVLARRPLPLTALVLLEADGGSTLAFDFIGAFLP